MYKTNSVDVMKGVRNVEVVAETNLCGGNHFGSNISLHEDSRLGKVHDLVSGYHVPKTKAAGWI